MITEAEHKAAQSLILKELGLSDEWKPILQRSDTASCNRDVYEYARTLDDEEAPWQTRMFFRNALGQIHVYEKSDHESGFGTNAVSMVAVQWIGQTVLVSTFKNGAMTLTILQKEEREQAETFEAFQYADKVFGANIMLPNDVVDCVGEVFCVDNQMDLMAAIATTDWELSDYKNAMQFDKYPAYMVIGDDYYRPITMVSIPPSQS